MCATTTFADKRIAFPMLMEGLFAILTANNRYFSHLQHLQNYHRVVDDGPIHQQKATDEHLGDGGWWESC